LGALRNQIEALARSGAISSDDARMLLAAVDDALGIVTTCSSTPRPLFFNVRAGDAANDLYWVNPVGSSGASFDAEFLSDLRSLQAAARPDLSHGEFPDLAKVRYYEITIFRVKPGYESGFAAVAKAYAGAAGKSAPKAAWRTYQVMAGAPGGTFLVFSSLESYAAFDDMVADGAKMYGAFSGDELVAMQKFLSEGLISSETNRFRLDPKQSYVPKELRERDPAFWMPKPAAAKKPGQP
jgi:hypothetical protein